MKTYPLYPSCFALLLVILMVQPGWSQRNRIDELRRQSRRESRQSQRQADALRRQVQRERARMPKDFGIQKALDVTEEQWKDIEPHFTRVKDLMQEANIGIGVMSASFGGGTSRGGGIRTSGSGGGGVAGGGFGGGSGGSGSGGSYRMYRSSGGNDPCEVVEESFEETKTIPTQYHWNWARPSARKKNLTRGEKACEALLDALEDKHNDPATLAAKLEEIKVARQVAQEQLPQAQAALRKVLNDRQQVIMALMGYL